MKAKRISETAYLLVFDRGDEVVQALSEFAADKEFAHFQAIGAFERATLAYWNAKTKEYEDLAVNEQVEVVSLLGDATRDEKGLPRIHAHASLGKRDGSLIGGHLKNGVVMPTLELVFTTSDVTIQRRLDDATGLSLIEL